MAGIKVVGLGPGRFGLITLETWEILKEAEHLYLRTAVHPTVEELRARGIHFASFDHFYEEAEDFASLYQQIAEELAVRAGSGEDVVYAVPGSPLVAERTVVLLREMAKERGIFLEVLPGMSFMEVLYARLGVDPIEGIAILDASDADRIGRCAGFPLVLTQLYHQHIASEAKLALSEVLPDDYSVVYVHDLALPDESVREISLYELDRQPDLDHLSSLFVPGVVSEK